MSLVNSATLARDAQFQGQVLAAVLGKVRSVLGNKAGETDFSYKMASAVVRAPESYVEFITWVVATDPTIAAAGTAYTEAQIIAALNTVWPFLAGL